MRQICPQSLWVSPRTRVAGLSNVTRVPGKQRLSCQAWQPRGLEVASQKLSAEARPLYPAEAQKGGVTCPGWHREQAVGLI